MALNNQEATIIPAGTSIAAGGTEAAPVTAGVGQTVGAYADYADSFEYRLTNGTSAPSVAPTMVFQASSATGRWYEVARISGDTVASSTTSGVIPVPAGMSYFRCLVFGNGTNPVTAECFLARQVP